MPLYDFACPDCSRRAEARLAPDAPAPECPGCGGLMRRLPAAPAVHGRRARGREAAIRSLDGGPGHSSGTACCSRHTHR